MVLVGGEVARRPLRIGAITLTVLAVIVAVLVPVFLLVPVTFPADAPRGAEVHCGIPIREGYYRVPVVHERDGDVWEGGEYNVACKSAMDNRKDRAAFAGFAAFVLGFFANVAWRTPRDDPHEADD